MRFSELERKTSAIPLILKLDAGGMPVRWIHWQDACIAHWNGKVVWSLGEELTLHGGLDRNGETSTFTLPTIISCNDQIAGKHKVPTLTNSVLFKRDQHLCMYCGHQFGNSKLTRDHVMPVSRGGPNKWENVVAACVSCNHKKADRTPEEAGLKLLAVPYAPNAAEQLILQHRHILADQMEYLKKMVPSSSRFWKNLH